MPTTTGGEEEASAPLRPFRCDVVKFRRGCVNCEYWGLKGAGSVDEIVALHRITGKKACACVLKIVDLGEIQV